MRQPSSTGRSLCRTLTATTMLAGALFLGAIGPGFGQSVDPLELALEQRPFFVELTELALAGDEATLEERIATLRDSNDYEELYGLGRFLANKPTEHILPMPDFEGAIAAFERSREIAATMPGRDARRLALRAQYEIARMIMRSRQDEESRDRALSMLTEAGNQGLGQAALVLGRAYLSGELGVVDETEAETWYRRALSLGVGSAAMELSSMLATSGNAEAETEAMDLARVGLAMLQREALEGDTDSAVLLGETYTSHPLVPSNMMEAQRWLSFAAGRGDAEGLIAQSEMLRGGAAGEPDPARSGDYLIQAANLGSTQAALDLARNLLKQERLNITVSTEESRLWLDRALAIEDPAAFYIAAQLAAQDGDFDLQRTLLNQAAELGNIDAMFELVQVHLTRGETDAVLALVERMERVVAVRDSAMVALAELKLSGDAQSLLFDVEGGLQLMQTAASMGNGRAMFQLSLIYQTGRLVEQDEAKAAQLLDASAAARHLPAVVHLADLNARGTIEGASIERAEELLNRARAIAREEGATGMLGLGRGMLSGVGRLDLQEEGVEWLEKAIALGSPRAMVSLADALQTGTAGRFDRERAMELYHEAIEYGDLTAHYQIGLAFATGSGVRIDFDAAMEHYRLAAAAGSADAAAELGLAYATGAFIEQDPDQAFDWLQRAADAGNVPAMIYIANLIAMDVLPGFSQDEAIAWMTRAANTGDIDAQFQLALTLDRGLVGEPDPEGARHWMGIAAQAGHFQAQMELERMLERGEDESS